MPKTARGLRASALNRLTYGCDIDGILPCKRSNCVWEERCRLDPYTRRHGWPSYGDPCHLEQRELEDYTLWAGRIYSYAKDWLTDEDFDSIIERLAVLRLRSRRIIQRMNHEGFVQYIELSDGRMLLREGIASRRYLASVQNQTDKLMERLAEEPATKAEKARRAKVKRLRDREARDRAIVRLMIMNGYWKVGDEALPDPSKAPEWIIESVDRERSQATGPN